jgi:glycosyltransferase involved in cell wall biosynthesis
MNDILISVIMPSLNAERTIERALESVRRQTLDQSIIEILVIDGGSSDATRSLAAKAGAIVIDNPGIVPEAAKRIGLKAARGKYALWLDTDEALSNPQQLQKRLDLFNSDPRIRAILPDGYITPEGYSGLAEYINCYGDAFSYFTYRYDSANMAASLKGQPAVNYPSGILFLFGDGDIIPIGDGGSTMFDLGYAKATFGEAFFTQDFAVTIFQSLVANTGGVGIIPADRIFHYATTTTRVFCNKLRFRARTNIHNMPGYGFSARARQNKALTRRKYLYPVYCLLFPWPMLDAIKMWSRKKHPAMLLHLFFTYYILFVVIWQLSLKALRITPGSTLYGK